MIKKITLDMAEHMFIGGLSSLAGFTIGYFAANYINAKNTPEAVIAELKTEKVLYKQAKEEAQQAFVKNQQILNDICKTKQSYQDEVRDEIEKNVRKELETYIAEADKKYEEAKLRLELAKSYKESQKETNYYDYLIAKEKANRWQ